MKGPTDRQREVLSYIARYIEENVYPPSIREIADHFGFSVKAAHDHIGALKQKNLLERNGSRSRTLRLSGGLADGLAESEPDSWEGDSDEDNDRDPDDRSTDSGNLVRIPIVGRVAAGFPILAEENRDGTVGIDVSMLKRNRTYFAVEVKGDSMEGAGILNGDTAIIEQQETVANGEIAVVLVDDEVTLKRFFLEGRQVRLQSENPAYAPMIFTEEVRVLGRLSHIFRNYDARY